MTLDACKSLAGLEHTMFSSFLQTPSVLDQMFVSSQNSYVEALICSVMVCGGATHRRYLGLDHVIRVKLP